MDDASADVLGATVRLADPAVRDALACSPSFAQETLEQCSACTPDVLRLYSAFIPNADEITTCLREKNAEFSDACKTVFEAGMKPPPAARRAC
jgi:hypothetical protein